MTATEDVDLGHGLPTPSIDPPEPPRPDELDTWSPGLTDESGELPVSDTVAARGADTPDTRSTPKAMAASDTAGTTSSTDVETGEPSG